MIDTSTPEELRQRAQAKINAAERCDDYTRYLYEKNEAMQMLKLANDLEKKENENS